MKLRLFFRAIISLFLIGLNLSIGVATATDSPGSKAIDISIRDYDGLGIGTLRNCTLNHVDCTPRRDCTPRQDCSGRHIDCTPRRDCTPRQDCSGRHIECGRKNPLAKLACEAEKETWKKGCEINKAAWKVDCERIKSSNKARCEAGKEQWKKGCEIDKVAWKLDCERIKTQDKVACEADKKAQQIDCERVKSLQMAAGEIAEALIHESKKQIMPHARPIPEFIRSRLAPFFSAALLDSVRWATERGNVFSIPAKYSIEIKEAGAITLDNLIVFKHESEGLYDVGLWAHELEHVKQYQDLGIDHFAEYYADYGLNSEFVILRNFPFFTDGFHAANWQEPTAKTCPASEECKRYIGSMVNKIEALASAQSVYVCRTLDPRKTYQTENIYNSEGVIIRKSLTACRPSYYDLDR